MKKKKLLFFISDMGAGGAQKVIVNYLAMLRYNPNYNCYLAVLGEPAHSDYEDDVERMGYHIIYGRLRHKGSFSRFNLIYEWGRGMIIVLRILIQVRPDIIHTHQTAVLPFITIPTLLVRIKKRIHTLHSDPDTMRRWPAKWGRIAFNIAHFMPVCVSNAQAEKAKLRYNIKDYTIIHNGLDYSCYSEDVDVLSIKKSLGIPPSFFVLGTVGRLHKVKNIGYLLKVFRSYLTNHKDSLLLIIGDGPEKSYLEQQAIQLGISSNVFFLGNRNDVPRLYRIMDVFMLASFYESASLVAVEAQLSGVKCIVSDRLPEDVMITDNISMLSIEQDPEIWAEAIDAPVSYVGKKYPKELYSIDEMIKETEKLYI